MVGLIKNLLLNLSVFVCVLCREQQRVLPFFLSFLLCCVVNVGYYVQSYNIIYYLYSWDTRMKFRTEIGNMILPLAEYMCLCVLCTVYAGL